MSLTGEVDGRIENWTLIQSFGHWVVYGLLYDDKKHGRPDGDSIRTSRLQSMVFTKGQSIVLTTLNSCYELGDASPISFADMRESSPDHF